MDSALILSAGLMGLAGVPHCAAMCGAACAAVTGTHGRAAGGSTWSTTLAFQGGRVLGYAAAGAAVSGGVQLLAWAGQGVAALRPFWVLVHAAALALGAWMVLTGRQPVWLGGIGRSRDLAPEVSSSWQPMRGPGRPAVVAAAGAAWVAWPCGLLHSALVVSGLTHNSVSGATAMAAFAVASAPGLQALPWLLRRHGAGTNSLQWVVRAAGLLLVLGALWALGHDLWIRAWVYCFG